MFIPFLFELTTPKVVGPPVTSWPVALLPTVTVEIWGAAPKLYPDFVTVIEYVPGLRLPRVYKPPAVVTVVVTVVAPFFSVTRAPTIQTGGNPLVFTMPAIVK